MKLGRLFGRGRERDREAVALVVSALSTHLGAPTGPDSGDRVALDVAGLECRVRIDAGGGENEVLPLWFEVGLPDGRTLEVGIGGWGQSLEERALDAAHEFESGVVSVLRRCFDQGATDPRVQVGTVTSVTADGEPQAWDMFLGPVTVMGERLTEAQAAEARSRLEGGRATGAVMDDVTGLLRDRRLHWLRLFLFRYPNGTFSGEVTLDNVRSEEAFDRLTKLDLPPEPSVLAFREFVAVTPSDRAVSAEQAEDLKAEHARRR